MDKIHGFINSEVSLIMTNKKLGEMAGDIGKTDAFNFTTDNWILYTEQIEQDFKAN